MPDHKTSTSTAKTLTPPRAAAVAGILFAVLMSTSLIIVRVAVPDARTDAGQWLTDPLRRNAVLFALQLAPFAGIAFLWFIGVVRNRLGQLEDQFFATVFFGSGLLFVASLFASAGLFGALLKTMADGHARVDNNAYYLIRQVGGSFLNVFAIKMAGVFVVSTGTIILRTGILPRWVAFSGFACALVLLLVITNWPWIALLFPLWILVVSVCVVLGRTHATAN